MLYSNTYLLFTLFKLLHQTSATIIPPDISLTKYSNYFDESEWKNGTSESPQMQFQLSFASCEDPVRRPIFHNSDRLGTRRKYCLSGYSSSLSESESEVSSRSSGSFSLENNIFESPLVLQTVPIKMKPTELYLPDSPVAIMKFFPESFECQDDFFISPPVAKVVLPSYISEDEGIVQINTDDDWINQFFDKLQSIFESSTGESPNPELERLRVKELNQGREKESMAIRDEESSPRSAKSGGSSGRHRPLQAKLAKLPKILPIKIPSPVHRELTELEKRKIPDTESSSSGSSTEQTEEEVSVARPFRKLKSISDNFKLRKSEPINVKGKRKGPYTGIV